jgi:hypothetical protein
VGRVRSFRFGPGRLESMRLRMWAVPRRDPSHTKAVRAEAVGVFTVYCGSGWEHQVDIEERHTFDLDRPADEIDRHLASAWREGDEDAADDATSQLIDWALEDWADPCLDLDEMDEEA